MLKIAQVGSIWHNTPPRTYGGTERIVYNLTEQLIKQGHDVTLFAAGTSQTSAKLAAVHHHPLIEEHISWKNLMYPLLHITSAFDRANEFDLLHVHLSKASDYIALPLAKELAHKVVFTIHFPYPTTQGRLDRHAVLQKYRHLNFISLSDKQRRGGENLNWVATVHNGIDITNYEFQPKPEEYVCWLGKFNPDKAVVEAIAAARQAGIKIKLAGAIDTLEEEDYKYFKKEVEPLINGEDVEYVGEVNEKQKSDLLGGAKGFLMSIKWEEPFGLTMIEALACGTPVIAFARGAAPEIIQDGQHGFLVNTVAEMASAIGRLDSIDRAQCRERVEKFFTAETMAKHYEIVYQRLLNK